MYQSFEHYSEILAHEFQKRQNSNQRYSLRAFARDLGISSASLSLCLRKQSGLSPKRAKDVAKRLHLNEQESKFFCELVQSASSKNSKNRESALKNLRQYETRYNTLTSDAFKAIADWYHFAVMELCRMFPDQVDADFISRRLGIPILSAKSAIDRMVRLGLLSLNSKNRWRVSTDYVLLPDGPADEAARSFHRQILTKALTALDQQSVDQRNISSVVLRVREQDLPKAADALKKFRREFSAEMESGEGHDRVYALSLQFFRVDC